MSTNQRRELPDCHAIFKAKYLYAARAILASGRQRLEPRAGLYIEPAEEGGVFVIAIGGPSLAIFYDCEGIANRRFRAQFPEEFVARCAPARVEMFLEGRVFVDLPEWAQPSDVHILPVCALLFAGMNHPAWGGDDDKPCLAHVMIETGNVIRAEDFRLDADKGLPWRMIFSRARGALSQICFAPERLANFDPVYDLFPEDEKKQFQVEFGDGPESPLFLRLPGVPEFIGALMPQKFIEADRLPVWATIGTLASSDAPNVTPFTRHAPDGSGESNGSSAA
ncbi:MAG: hypothetical protein ACR652_00635 [Methylocystis sp.]|uniref:hypothetical protein n=1 Tax=Methylocystis sp. TaxID=1911079 RepID=UPI003DA21FFB